MDTLPTKKSKIFHLYFYCNFSPLNIIIFWFDYYSIIYSSRFDFLFSVLYFYNILQSFIRFLITAYFSHIIRLYSSTSRRAFYSSAFWSFIFCDCLSMLFRYRFSLSCSCLFAWLYDKFVDGANTTGESTYFFSSYFFAYFYLRSLSKPLIFYLN